MPLNEQNIYSVQPSPLDYSDPKMPATRTKVYHGFGVVVGSKFIGSIQSWQPASYDRTLTPVRELSPATFGRHVDLVPGVGGDPTISMTRIEIWEDELEKALGLSTQEWIDLVSQDKPFKVMEVWYKGKALYRMWEYVGCWFSQKNPDGYSADGDGIVKITATIGYVTRRLAYGK